MCNPWYEGLPIPSGTHCRWHAYRMGAVHDLEERPITFDYEYKMSCPDCPGITTLTSAEYYSEPNGAHGRSRRTG